MTSNKESWIKSPWTISIGTAIFSLLLTIGYDSFKQKPILTTIWSIIKWIGNIFWVVLDYDLKVWWILAALILLILVGILMAKFGKKEGSQPDFYSYREDQVKKWKWSWNWQWNQRRTVWQIADMKAHCPKCNTPMIEGSGFYGYRFDCPRCDFAAIDNECEDPQKIERIILDNIERRRQQSKSDS